jgi:hypothetical protein
MNQVSSTALYNDQEYFKPTSDVKCHHCGRFLLYDPRKPETVETSQRTTNFWNWCHEDLKHRYQFLDDESIWNCQIHGLCHEKCDYEFHETHGIPIQ